MNIEQNLIIAILKTTKKGPVTHEILNNATRIPSDIRRKLLHKLQTDGLVYLGKEVLEANNIQRLKLAAKAIGSGADIENISGFLQWQEFENMAAIVLESNGFNVSRNLRFKHVGRRWEIDVVGWRKPLVLCVDCKHWHSSMSHTSLKGIVTDQIERTRALCKILPNPLVRVNLSDWGKPKFVPAVLSLFEAGLKLCCDVPVVPVLQFQDFLDQLPAYVDSLFHLSSRDSGIPFDGLGLR